MIWQKKATLNCSSGLQTHFLFFQHFNPVNYYYIMASYTIFYIYKSSLNKLWCCAPDRTHHRNQADSILVKVKTQNRKKLIKKHSNCQKVKSDQEIKFLFSVRIRMHKTTLIRLRPLTKFNVQFINFVFSQCFKNVYRIALLSWICFYLLLELHLVMHWFSQR